MVGAPDSRRAVVAGDLNELGFGSTDRTDRRISLGTVEAPPSAKNLFSLFFRIKKAFHHNDKTTPQAGFAGQRSGVRAPPGSILLTRCDDWLY